MAEVAIQEVRQGLPTVLEPFFIGTAQKPGLLPQAEKVYGRTYEQTYKPVSDAGLMGVGRIAPLSGTMLETAQAGLAGLGPASGFSQGEQQLGMASNVFQNLSGIQAPTVTADALTQYQMAGPQMFDAQAAAQYMSPYQKAVTERAKQTAIENAQLANLNARLGSVRQGTYGGARQALSEGQQEAALRSQLSALDVQGMQEAYLNAQQQFERDRAAQQAAAQQNLAAALGVQQTGAQQNLTAQQANQAAALQAAQQRQAAAQGLAGLGLQYAGLGTQEQESELQRLQAQTQFGQLQRDIGQQGLSAEYEDAMRQAGYPEYQVSGLSNILRGTPTATSQMSQSTPSPGFLDNLIGGITGLYGTYKLFDYLGK